MYGVQVIQVPNWTNAELNSQYVFVVAVGPGTPSSCRPYDTTDNNVRCHVRSPDAINPGPRWCTFHNNGRLGV